ncbi:LPXTG cell wall anchor domain-containing protein [Enterococcus durans]|uniref:LPXTG cell wall anchor domain-containing protein n=1 Tax=Enterococcus durans TaxID=53345 RepID=UPI000E1BD674
MCIDSLNVRINAYFFIKESRFILILQFASEKNQKSVHSDSKSEKELPKTGEKQSNSTAMLGILLSIGSGMIFWKKKKESE